MRKKWLIGFGIVALFFASTAFAYSHVLWLSTIAYSDFKQISDNIFIDPELNKHEYERILTLIDESKSRIRNTYGSFTALPVVVITGTPENAKRYGLGVFPGKAFAAPWEEYVVVKFQADNVDLLAHELMHAQTREILGYWAYQTRIPTWFDEGMAMQVDFRERYKFNIESFSKQEINRVKVLSRPSNFWTDSKEQDIKNYRAAKAAVQKILSKYSPEVFYSMLLEVRHGKQFSSVFNE